MSEGQDTEQLPEGEQKADFNGSSDDFNELRNETIKLISNLREKHNLSYNQIAKKIGCNKSMIYQILKKIWFWKPENKQKAEGFFKKLMAIQDNFDGVGENA